MSTSDTQVNFKNARVHYEYSRACRRTWDNKYCPQTLMPCFKLRGNTECVYIKGTTTGGSPIHTRLHTSSCSNPQCCGLQWRLSRRWWQPVSQDDITWKNFMLLIMNTGSVTNTRDIPGCLYIGASIHVHSPHRKMYENSKLCYRETISQSDL